jgi:hexosaminidase
MVKFKVGAVILALAVTVILSVQAAKHFESDSNNPAILPLPSHLEAQKGNFDLGPTTCIFVDPSEPAGQSLAERLRNSTGYEIPLRPLAAGSEGRGAITLSTQGADASLGSEGYTLEVTPDRVVLHAHSSAGLFYGTQSLLQLLPAQIFSNRPVTRRAWKIPCVRIKDTPRFPWRGFMLDVSRHFFSPAEIKCILDAMALHKLNTFHWHLTDDQGWRIEIKKYPRLTEIGSWRKRIGFNLDPKSSMAYDAVGRYGGYYSQADIRDIVSYAQARHITIVPEIDMPGHSSAVLAAYPQFSCSGGPYSTDMSETVSAGVLCPGNEETFEFLDNVLSEVIDLFPGEFIHVGGDEVPKQNWHNCARCQARRVREGLKSEHELQDYFVSRIEQFVNEHGKRLIGWSEIQQDNLKQSTVLMDWIGGGVEAARTGHDVVMSPEEHCYLDFYQSKDRSNEPPAAGAFLPLEKIYGFDPTPENLDPEQQKHILGAQANLWTEYIPSLGQLEYMAFPRLSALAEVVWSPKNSRNWQDFSRRLVVQEQRLDQLGVKYRRSALGQVH